MPIYIVMRGRKIVCRVGREEAQGRVGGGETILIIQRMKKSIFNKRLKMDFSIKGKI